MVNNIDHEFKIILLGESGVGKTSLTHMYRTGRFNPKCQVTVVVDRTTKELSLNGKRIKLCIWDTAGQERSKSLIPKFFRGVDGVLLVYDTTNTMTFNALSNWLTLFKEKSDGAVALVVGNKIDHPNSTAVCRNVAMRFARDENLEFMETSAKNGDNVTEIFENIASKIIQAKNLVTENEMNTQCAEPVTLLKPDNSSNGLETPGTPEQATASNESNNPAPNTSSDKDDAENIDDSFVFVSFLPAVVPLPVEIPHLQVGERRAESPSDSGGEIESEHNIRLYSEISTPKKNRSSC